MIYDDKGKLLGTFRDLSVRGAARQKLRDVSGAIADFETLLRRFPCSYLRAAARENPAILYEKRGNMVAALEHYFVLGYDADIAFLLDARMTTNEIERFIAARPRHRKRDLLIYSLGIRYLHASFRKAWWLSGPRWWNPPEFWRREWVYLATHFRGPEDEGPLLRGSDRDTTGRLWVGLWNAGLMAFDGHRWLAPIYRGLPFL